MKHFEVDNPNPEFVIGLAAPVGTDLRQVASVLAQEMRAYRYHPIPIRVSELLQQWCSDDSSHLSQKPKRKSASTI